MPSRTVGTTAVNYLAAGTYKRSLQDRTSIQWTAGTEDEIEDLAAHIVTASGADALFSWVRGHILVGCATSSDNDGLIAEWMVIKCAKTAALQDLNSSAVVEALQKESRIFARGILSGGGLRMAGPRPIKFEFFNVKLATDEELRLVVRPFQTVSGAYVFYVGVIEWRQVGV